MTLDLFLQHLSNGISLGSLYALIAIGYTMVYGILRLINLPTAIFLMIHLFCFFRDCHFPDSLVHHLPLVLVLTAALGMGVEAVGTGHP